MSGDDAQVAGLPRDTPRRFSEPAEKAFSQAYENGGTFDIKAQFGFGEIPPLADPTIPIPRPRPAMSEGAPPLAGPRDNRAPPSIGPRPDDLVPPISDAERALAQRAQRTIAGSAGASALSYPSSDSGLYSDPRSRSFFSPQRQFPEQRFEGSPKSSPFASPTPQPLDYAPTPQRGRAHAAIDDLLAPSKPPAPRASFWPHASEAAAAAADVDDEIDKIERRLRTDRRGYFRDEDMQERYRELLTIRGRRRR